MILLYVGHCRETGLSECLGRPYTTLVVSAFLTHAEYSESATRDFLIKTNDDGKYEDMEEGSHYADQSQLRIECASYLLGSERGI